MDTTGADPTSLGPLRHYAILEYGRFPTTLAEVSHSSYQCIFEMSVADLCNVHALGKAFRQDVSRGDRIPSRRRQLRQITASAAETFSTTLPELLSLFIHADLTMLMKEPLLAKAWSADLKQGLPRLLQGQFQSCCCTLALAAVPQDVPARLCLFFLNNAVCYNSRPNV